MTTLHKAAVLERVAFVSLLVLFTALSFSTALGEISFVAAFLAWLAAVVLVRRNPFAGLPGTVLLGLGAFVSLSLISYFWSDVPRLSGRGIFKVLQQILVFVMVFDVVRRRDRLRQAEKMILGLMAVVTVNSLFQYFTGSDFIRQSAIVDSSSGPRISASFKSYGQLAAFLVLCVPIIATLVKTGESRGEKILSAVLLAAGLTCLFLTRSRGAMLAALGGILLVLLLKKKFIWILCLLFITGTGLLFIPRSMIIHFDIENKEQSLNERLLLWERAINVIQAKPLTGTGINTYHAAHAKYDKTGSTQVLDYYAHNGYLQMAAETGLPSLFFFLFLLASLLAWAWRAAMQGGDLALHTAGLWTGSLSFLLLAFVDTGLHSSQSVMTFWFIFGLLAASASQSLPAGREEAGTTGAPDSKRKIPAVSL